MQAVTEIKDESAAPRRPTRTCAGCGEHGAPEDLVRLVLGPVSGDAASEASGVEIAVDLAGGSFGRGAHVHATPTCFTRACKGGLARTFKTKVRVTPAELAGILGAAAERRIAGLLGGAKRAKQLAVGADSVRDALSGGAPLVIVARDAGAVATRTDMMTAISDGRAIPMLDKAALGALLGREEVAVAAVLGEGIANEIKRVYSMADAVRAMRGQLEV